MTEQGIRVSRKWLADRSEFNRDPRLGWAREHWFEWKANPKGGE